MGGHEVVFAEAEEDVRFAYSAIADDEQFDQMVVAVLLLHYSCGFVLKYIRLSLITVTYRSG